MGISFRTRKPLIRFRILYDVERIECIESGRMAAGREEATSQQHVCTVIRLCTVQYDSTYSPSRQARSPPQSKSTLLVFYEQSMIRAILETDPENTRKKILEDPRACIFYFLQRIISWGQTEHHQSHVVYYVVVHLTVYDESEARKRVQYTTGAVRSDYCCCSCCCPSCFPNLMDQGL
jgi:hypothetical protein